MERDNRKSHLVPQLSPSGTHDLLRSSDSSPQSRNEEPPLDTPIFGDIPIAGAGIFSPRDQAPAQNRSPSRNGASVSRPAHPGLGQRGATTNSIPQLSSYPDVSHHSSSSATTFNLPVRPAPPTSAFASQGAPQKPASDEVRGQSRRQPKYGLPPNPSYGV
jgi:mitogen-activated protein kinase kinase